MHRHRGTDADLLALVGRGPRTEWVFAGLDPIPFAVRATAQKGYGAFALRDIAEGELIIAEAPLVRWALPPGDELIAGGQAHAATADEVKALIRSLSASGRSAFWELCGPAGEPDDSRTADGIWRSNAFRILDEDEGAYHAIFARCARINHACVPNAYVAFNDEVKRQSLRALRGIRQGEELLVNYTGNCTAGMTRAERRDEMHRRWGFSCACAACAIEGEALAASDERRRRIARLAALVEAEADDGRVSGLVEEELALMRAEGLPEVWATNEMLRASLCANRAGETELAARWWLRMHRATKVALGFR